MGNIAMMGAPPEMLVAKGVDYMNYPPWIITMFTLQLDMLFNLVGLRYTWRNYLPLGLADKGGWFSEEFESDHVMQVLSEPYTFEEFRADNGFNVTKGSGIFAGVHGWNDVSDWMKSLYTYAFETPSTSLSILTTWAGLGMLACLVLLLKAIKSLVMPRFQSIGRELAMKTHGKAWLNDNQERIIKFGEYVFRLFYHSFISLVGFYFFWNAPWLDKEAGGAENFYNNFPDEPVSPKMTWYYLFQGAYNVDAFISLLQLSLEFKFMPKNSLLPVTLQWSKTVRGDFNEMMAHHLVTNALIFTSSLFRQTRIGSMVFWVHDISDVPVDLAKLANFVKWKKATVIAFVALCLVWLYTRLIVLPFYIWSSLFFEGWRTVKVGTRLNFYYYTFQPMFVIFLGVLIALHLVWFSMFINMGIVLVTKGEAHDLSEHKDGEKQDSTAGQKQNGVANGNGHINGSKTKVS